MVQIFSVMADDSNGRPIPKIVGRGKNRLKRPHTAHSYDLRSTITRCQSSEDANCSFCHFYRTSHGDLLEYNEKLRTHLLKAATRTLIVNKWSRQKDGKIRKLRGLLQERADELRDKNIEMQEYLREARIRKEELRHTVTQLQQSREKVADLHCQLEHAEKRVKILEEVRSTEKQEVTKIKDSLRSLIEHLSPLLLELHDESNGSDPNEPDDQSISAKLDSLRKTLALCEAEISREPGEVTENDIDVCNAQELLEKMIAEVKCGVCQDLFIDPVALPCGHVFCEFCIRMWFKRIRGCPVCRRKVITCSQLHAVYQFREIVGLLNEYRETEERENRSQEVQQRKSLQDELYSDPLPRRSRERPSSSSDRGERFTSRRRRLENGTPSVPYPIPLPDSGLPTARLDVLPPMRDSHPPIPFIPQQINNPFEQLDVGRPPNLGPESPRNMMSLLLNETFSSIGRFIRGGPDGSAFPTIRPLNMIEYSSEGVRESNIGQTASSSVEPSAMITGLSSLDDLDTNRATISAQVDQMDIGTSANPIIVQDISQEELPSRTPPGTPPEVSRSRISDSSEEIWPGPIANTAQHTDTEPLLPNNRVTPVSSSIAASNESDDNATEIYVEASTSGDGDIRNLMDGEFLSSSSQSDTTLSETESDTETETSSDEDDLPATEESRLSDID